MLTSPQKRTTKTMNEQLCPEEDEPVRAPERTKEASDTQTSAEHKGGHVEKHSKHFTGIARSPSPARLGTKGAFPGTTPPGGKKSRRPRQPSSWPLTPTAFHAKDPTVFTDAEPSCQGSLESVPLHPSPPWRGNELQLHPPGAVATTRPCVCTHTLEPWPTTALHTLMPDTRAPLSPHVYPYAGPSTKRSSWPQLHLVGKKRTEGSQQPLPLRTPTSLAIPVDTRSLGRHRPQAPWKGRCRAPHEIRISVVHPQPQCWVCRSSLSWCPHAHLQVRSVYKSGRCDSALKCTDMDARPQDT